MRDILDFKIVGVPYSSNPTLAKTLKEGDLLELRRDYNNPKDSNAIGVYFNDQHIGYVPNRGCICGFCKEAFPVNDSYCTKCGAGWEAVIKGGLATRIILNNILEKEYTCIVKNNEGAKEDYFITVTLIS